MLEANFKEDDVSLDASKSKLITYNNDLSPYENLKLAVNTLENIAFDQIDEDISVLQKETYSNPEVLGKTKIMLKAFMLLQKIQNKHITYSLNYGLIIQKLLKIFTEERSFYVFLCILDNLSAYISIQNSVLLDRHGMFRTLLISLLTNLQIDHP